MVETQLGAASCCFCEEINLGEMPGAFIAKMGQNDRVVLRDGHFVAIPSVSPLCEGHTLIVPRAHLTSLAQLNRHLRESLTRFIQRVIARVRDRYGAYFLFEHGVGAGRTGGCGVAHAHLHVLPLSRVHAEQVYERVRSDYPCQSSGPFTNVLASTSSRATYLLCGDSLTKVQRIVQDEVPSQYLRKLLAEILGKYEWDWNRLEGWNEMVATYAALRG